MATGPAPEPLLTFPPFPPIAEGHTLVPFKDFKPSGIQMFPGEDEGEIELDGLGIPTIELRVKHDTDEPKTGKRKGKKKKKKHIEIDGEPMRRLTWWEEWEEGEDLRVSNFGYSSAMPRVDRLFKASQDFTEGRRWPGLNTGVRNFWDQYRIFLGLLVIPVFRKPLTEPNSNKRGRDEPADIALGEGNASASKAAEGVPSKKGVGDMDDLDDDDDDDEDDALEKNVLEAEEFREDRLIAFLNDPEKVVQIFLSSYMREKGLIWSDRNLVIGPRITTFFINFLIRNNVLPESHHERGFKRALELAELALKELPLTAKIGQALPDDLSLGLKECFGQMSGGSFLLNGVALKEWGKWESDNKKDTQDDEGERQTKKQKLDEEEGLEAEKGEEKGEEKIDDFEAELKAANIEVIHTDTLPNIEKEIIGDNIGMDVDLGSGASWDCPDKQWIAGDDGWDKAPGAGTSDPSGWGEPCPGQENPWDLASRPSLLMKILGPTILPLTHTTGIVEQSTRRIKTIILPPAIPAKSVVGGSEGEDPESVEEELEKLFAKVVLEPWVGEETSDIRRPIIRASSKGPVVPGSLMEDGTTVEGGAPAPEAKGTIHNPLESDITLLIDPACADLISPRMGLLATWVQIVRQEEKPKSESTSGTKPKKRKKGKKTPKGYWYMEELLVTFPSFYTQEKLIQIT